MTLVFVGYPAKRCLHGSAENQQRVVVIADVDSALLYCVWICSLDRVKRRPGSSWCEVDLIYMASCDRNDDHIWAQVPNEVVP